MKALFFEMIFRSLIMLAKALWRRMPHTPYGIFLYSYYYVVYTLIIFISLLTSPQKVGITMVLWTWFREIDDILDGDDYQTPATVEKLLFRKKIVVQNLSKEIILKELHGNDRLLFLGVHLSKKLKIENDFTFYFQKVWELMLAEYDWRMEKRIPSKVEIKTFARLQDEAILFFGKMFLWVDINTFKLLEIAQDGLFTRIDWIEDLKRDLKAGIVHLPMEKCLQNNLSYEELVSIRTKDVFNHPSLQKMVKEELTLLVLLWQQFSGKRQDLLNATRSKVFAFIYNKFVINRFENELKKLCGAYGIVFG